MFPKLLLLFILVPIIELYLLVQVGSVLGAGTTILLVIATGVAGAWLARTEGFNTMMKVRENVNLGKMPADELVEGLLILVAGLMLLTPGLITDAAGLVLLLPPSRRRIARWLRKEFGEAVRVHGAGMQGGAGGAGFTYYTWHSTRQYGDRRESFLRDAGREDGAASRIRDAENSGTAGTAGTTGAAGMTGVRDGGNLPPRRAVVIDCEPVHPSAESDTRTDDNGSGK
ncbi:FxsA family protein [Desulfovibrio psychrotolerans]|nr:FxsA family protein [Desulfovibrio psychrotolerans]